jgi:hypothetical protein
MLFNASTTPKWRTLELVSMVQNLYQWKWEREILYVYRSSEDEQVLKDCFHEKTKNMKVAIR